MSVSAPKILVLYNWAQFDDSQGRGGGVSVYLRSIIPFYLKLGYKIHFISAGCHYSLFTKKVFYQKTENIFSNQGVDSYRIVNSPVKAPADDAFFQIEECLNNQEIVHVFLSIIKDIGKVDEIHFHNIEGISTLLIEELAQSELSKVVVWFHNYHWVCPQVDLFKDNVKPCDDFNSGSDCIGCPDQRRDADRQKRIQSFISLFELNFLFKGKYGAMLRKVVQTFYVTVKSVFSAFRPQDCEFGEVSSLTIDHRTRIHTQQLNKWKRDAALYSTWRSENIRRLNSCVDNCVVVSGLVRDKLVEFGISKGKILVAPLGMDVYRSDYIEYGKQRATRVVFPIRIGFVGYSKEAKGLSFFIRSLSKLEDKFHSQIKIHIVSKLSDQMRRRVVRLSEKFDVTLTEGYERSELKELTDSFDIVVIPPVWWETFNQVAYEMLMFGVPVIISDSAGIFEYINPEFSFKSGSEESLAEKIREILRNPAMLSRYWKGDSFSLPCLQEHFESLFVSGDN